MDSCVRCFEIKNFKVSLFSKDNWLGTLMLNAIFLYYFAK